MSAPTTVHVDGLTVEVSSSASSTYKTEGVTLEVAWQDRVLEDRAAPESFILFQDPALSGESAITSTTSELEPYISTAMAVTSNEGDLVPFPSGEWIEEAGTPDPAPDDLLFQVVQTGSLYDSAEWVWKLDRHGASSWNGMDDLRWNHKVEEPYNTYPSTAGQNPAICYSKIHQRVIISIVDGTSFSLKYRPLHSTTWVNVTVTPPFGKEPVPGYDACAIVELPDGALRLLYMYQPATTAISYHEVAMLGSSNGGVNWELLKDGIVTDILGEPSRIRSLRCAQSGDYSRLEMWVIPATGAEGLVSACSSDRMATWKTVRGTPDGKDKLAASTFSPYIYGIAAADDQGTFIRMRLPDFSAGYLRLFFELASRDSEFSNITQTTTSAFPVTATSFIVGGWVASGGGRIFTLLMYDNGSGIVGWSYSSFIIPMDRLADGYDEDANPRERWTQWGNYDWEAWGGVAFTPTSGDMVWAGDRLLLFCMPMERGVGTGLLNLKGFALSTFGGPSQRPLRLPFQTHRDVDNIFARSWKSMLGPPVGVGASAFSPWNTSSGGSPSTSVKLDRFDVLCDAATGDRLGWAYTNPSSGLTQHIGDAGVVQWVTRAVVPNRGPDNTRPAITRGDLIGPHWGVLLQTASRHAGITSEVAVHLFGDGGLAVYDLSTLTTMYVGAPGTLAGITTGTWYDFRLSIAETDVAERSGPNAHFIELSWAQREPENAPWSSSGVHTLSSSTTVLSSESVSFGVLDAPSVDHDVSFAECAISRPFSHRPNGNAMGTLSSMPFGNPGDMRGFDCMPHQQLSAQGIEVRWGGAGGFIGDSYRAPIQYQNASSLILSDSTASKWKSTSTALQTIVLDAEGTTHKGRWQHSGIAFFGGNSRRYTVEYAEDAAFTTPSTFHLDGLRAEVLIEKELGGGRYRVSGSALNTWRDGELIGWYFRVGSAIKYGKIRGNVGDELELLFDGTPLTHGLAAGATMQLWAPDQAHLFHDYPMGVRVRTATAGLTSVFPRYMRITLDGDAVAGRPYEGLWQIGRLQAGLTLPISVPMDWQTQNDDEDPNINLSTMISGTRIAYKQGKPRLSIRGTSRGDVDRWRVTFRSMIRNIAGYSEKLIMLCTDDRELHLRSTLVRFTGSTEFANSGWRYNRTTSRWEQVGDLQMRFEEEV
mgnify:CR=1 FL=1